MNEILRSPNGDLRNYVQTHIKDPYDDKSKNFSITVENLLKKVVDKQAILNEDTVKHKQAPHSSYLAMAPNNPLSQTPPLSSRTQEIPRKTLPKGKSIQKQHPMGDRWTKPAKLESESLGYLHFNPFESSNA